MNIEQFYEELERDREWRQAEIRMLQNLVASVDEESERTWYRRAIILLLYAHLEGFCRFALLRYVRAVNGLGIKCGEANVAVAAASLADVFEALRDSRKKCAEFRRDLPDDTALHRFARDQEFVEQTKEIDERPVKIEDAAVDLESNLKPVVLRKNLYRLGLPYEKDPRTDAIINRLLGIRNSISHGESRSGVSQKDYEGYRDTAFALMATITRQVVAAMRGRKYLRTT